VLQFYIYNVALSVFDGGATCAAYLNVLCGTSFQKENYEILFNLLVLSIAKWNCIVFG
jgi:hypothetical protein